ncbi:hypothetical protein C5167_044598 [Papaver somniferum]|uniref:Uncharacterized protein n=1 Tax=Papaver somniferum TaxID=3469 RepID=A0A4Y7LCX0_PAPSO|nr:hypothetical protein C5167_044598 [Papaver somniferum]
MDSECKEYHEWRSHRLMRRSGTVHEWKMLVHMDGKCHVAALSANNCTKRISERIRLLVMTHYHPNGMNEEFQQMTVCGIYEKVGFPARLLALQTQLFRCINTYAEKAKHTTPIKLIHPTKPSSSSSSKIFLNHFLLRLASDELKIKYLNELYVLSNKVMEIEEKPGFKPYTNSLMAASYNGLSFSRREDINILGDRKKQFPEDFNGDDGKRYLDMMYLDESGDHVVASIAPERCSCKHCDVTDEKKYYEKMGKSLDEWIELTCLVMKEEPLGYKMIIHAVK